MNVNYVTPPHTVHTIKNCLCFAEQLSDHRDIQLFQDISNDTGLDEDIPISILTGNGPGFTPANPMALVPRSKPTASQNKPHRLRAKYHRRLL